MLLNLHGLWSVTPTFSRVLEGLRYGTWGPKGFWGHSGNFIGFSVAARGVTQKFSGIPGAWSPRLKGNLRCISWLFWGAQVLFLVSEEV